ncbi:MAG: triose-phosphate isomerase [Bacteroidetes bacterium]|nr:triose-phosphate isomerase [Bacteroidota bacterium]
MRKKIVAGNWKMNKTQEDAKNLVEAVLSSCKDEAAVTKIFFPPMPFLGMVSSLVQGTSSFSAGAQNCHYAESGAFTGETSAAAIASCGASYVLVGHSERRQYFLENDEQLKQKIDRALGHSLSPIYCVGEQLAERNNHHYFTVIKNQLQNSLFHLSESAVLRTVIAYEPVWAIGTGLTATPDQAQEMHAFIRLALTEKYGIAVAQKISVLYGGSCNAKNAKELFACPDVDGGLIGGASLIAEDFVKIAHSF